MIKQVQEHLSTPNRPYEPQEFILRCRTCGQEHARLTSHDIRSTTIWAKVRAHCIAEHGWEPER